MRQSGFTAVELLITLFIAAVFLASGYQLYSVIIKDGGETRAQTKASNTAYDYLRRYSTNATSPCTPQTPLTNSPLTVTGLSSVTITVVISCPYPSSTAVSKVQATVNYNNPQQVVTNAVYVSQ
jgi:prepilin-type N-terminal cleavage/methylation domain-containing protein